jgi:hypothetical protein
MTTTTISEEGTIIITDDSFNKKEERKSSTSTEWWNRNMDIPNSWFIFIMIVLWTFLCIFVLWAAITCGRREQKSQSKKAGRTDYTVWFEIIVVILILILFFKR